MYSAGLVTDLGTIQGGGVSYALAINAAGQVTGYSTTGPRSGEEHAFLSAGSVMTDLNSLLPANSGWVLARATGINDAGQIVGYGTKNGAPRGFLLEGAAADPSRIQTITFAPFSTVTLGAAPFDIDYLATTDYGLVVSYSSATPVVCTVRTSFGTFNVPQNTVNLVAAGTCSIIASQPGNANYLPATPVTQSFTVNPAPGIRQTITFRPLSDVTFGTAPFAVAATASSGLPVTFTGSPAAVCTAGGATVTITGVGRVRLLQTRPEMAPAPPPTAPPHR